MAFRLTSEGFDAPHDAIARRDGPADDEDRIVSTHNSEDIGPGFAIESCCDGLRPARHSSKHDHFAGAVDAQKKLRKKRFECGSTLLDGAIRNPVTGAFGGGNAREAKLT